MAALSGAAFFLWRGKDQDFFCASINRRRNYPAEDGKVLNGKRAKRHSCARSYPAVV